MTDKKNDPISEAEINKLIEDGLKATRSKNVEALMPGYATGVIMFDVVDQLKYNGSDAVRQRMEQWFSSFDGPIEYDVQQIDITASAEVAFCHSLNHVVAVKKDGGKLDMWWRATVGYRKAGGKWMITHQHSSVPFNADTGQASLDLTPE